MVADDTFEGPQLPEKTLIGWSLSPEKAIEQRSISFSETLTPFSPVMTWEKQLSTLAILGNSWQHLAPQLV